MVGRRKKTKMLNTAVDAEHAKNLKIIFESEIKKEQAQIERLKKEKLQGQLVSIKETQEAILEIGSKTKAQLYRLVSTLPPKLEGLNAKSMIEIIRISIDEICLELSNSFNIIDQPILEVIEDDDEYEDDED